MQPRHPSMLAWRAQPCTRCCAAAGTAPSMPKPPRARAFPGDAVIWRAVLPDPGGGFTLLLPQQVSNSPLRPRLPQRGPFGEGSHHCQLCVGTGVRDGAEAAPRPGCPCLPRGHPPTHPHPTRGHPRAHTATASNPEQPALRRSALPARCQEWRPDDQYQQQPGPRTAYGPCKWRMVKNNP